MEKWRAIPDWPEYEVSDLGRVRSVDRLGPDRRGGTRHVRGAVLRLKIDRYGYVIACLTRSGHSKYIPVHTLVLRAFISERPSPDHEARHDDGCRSNNSVGNLLWGTAAENQHDRVRHGTDPVGSRNPCAKLTEAMARLVRSVSGEFSQRELATIFGVSKRVIFNIQAGQSWKHA